MITPLRIFIERVCPKNRPRVQSIEHSSIRVKAFEVLSSIARVEVGLTKLIEILKSELELLVVVLSFSKDVIETESCLSIARSLKSFR